MSEFKCIVDNFKIVAYGPACWVPAISESWILDHETTVSNMLDVANFEKIKLTGKKKDEIMSSIEDYCKSSENKIPLIKEKMMQEVISDIITAGFEAGKSDNEMLSDMVMAGVPFGDVAKLFKKFVVDNKLRMSSKERKQKMADILVDWSTDSVDEVLSMVSKIKDACEATEAQAMSAIRRHAKEQGWEVPKAKKEPKARVTKFTKIAKWVLENPDCTEPELQAAVNELLGEKSSGYAAVFKQSIDFATDYAEAKGWIEVEQSEEAA